MSYIRCSTPVKKRKGDRRFEKISNTYAWWDVDGYIHITNGWKRMRERYIRLLGKKEGEALFKKIHKLSDAMVLITPAEMRYMCRQFVGREMGQLKGFDRRMQPLKKRNRPSRST